MRLKNYILSLNKICLCCKISFKNFLSILALETYYPKQLYMPNSRTYYLNIQDINSRSCPDWQQNDNKSNHANIICGFLDIQKSINYKNKFILTIIIHCLIHSSTNNVICCFLSYVIILNSMYSNP